MAKHVPHATYTDSELLDLTRASIADILATGQSHSITGKTMAWADLDDLYAQELKWQNRVAGSAIATNLTRHGRNGGSLIKT